MAAMDTTLDSALPCIDCGYDLRGMEADNNCPKCGASVERSMRGDRLCFANPRWLAKVKWGVGLIAISGMLMFILGWLSTLLFERWPSLLHNFFGYTYGGLFFVSHIVWLIGAWLAVSQEPVDDRAVQLKWPRVIVRISVVLLILANNLALLLLFGVSVDMVNLASFWMATLVSATLQLALYCQLYSVITRIPRPTLLPITIALAAGEILILLMRIVGLDAFGEFADEFVTVGESVLGIGTTIYFCYVFFMLHHQHHLARKLTSSHA